jgi:cysteine desulfurase
MHVNNETGVLQPLEEICQQLAEHSAYLHVDASQGFGKELLFLRNPRIDLISVSGHKIYAPKGVGALISRRRRRERLPIYPLMVGGGQERGLRPGTLPVPLIAALGAAAEMAVRDHSQRLKKVRKMQEEALAAFLPLGTLRHGDPVRTLPHTLSISWPGVDADAVMVAWKGIAAVSRGAACTSQAYSTSHVLEAMRLPEDIIRGAVRISWCHLTEHVPWASMVTAVKKLI